MRYFRRISVWSRSTIENTIPNASTSTGRLPRRIVSRDRNYFVESSSKDGGFSIVGWEASRSIRTKRIEVRRSLSFSNRHDVEPKWTNRNKRDLFILLSGVCGAATYLASFAGNDWEEEVRRAKHAVLLSSRQDWVEETMSEECIPPPVLRYITEALLNSNIQANTQPMVLIVDQSGEFYAAYQWYPFEGTFTSLASLRTPGFVWDAKTKILKVPHHILEYFVTNRSIRVEQPPEGNGCITTKAWGKYPLIQVDEDDPFLLFWLAMTPLVPEFFAQQAQDGILKWNDSSSHNHASARLICDDGQERLVQVSFCEESGLLERIRVKGKNQEYCWQATYIDYRRRTVHVKQSKHVQTVSLLLPETIEIGKGSNDDYRPHFKIRNHSVEYTYLSGK